MVQYWRVLTPIINRTFQKKKKNELWALCDVPSHPISARYSKISFIKHFQLYYRKDIHTTKYLLGINALAFMPIRIVYIVWVLHLSVTWLPSRFHIDWIQIMPYWIWMTSFDLKWGFQLYCDVLHPFPLLINNKHRWSLDISMRMYTNNNYIRALLFHNQYILIKTILIIYAIEVILVEF